MTRRVRVKPGQRGWFAAGPGFERAMGELSDAAFKVFAYVCLRAERGSGCLEFEREGLSREVGKSRSTLGRCLRELAGKQVCELEPAPNQHRLSRLRVRAEYWPYEMREVEPARQPGRAARSGPGKDGGDVAAYVRAVRQWFCQPACVQGRFGPADKLLATDWQRAGVPLETVRRAILLGSVRKSMSLLDRPGGQPVRSLRYFTGPLEEVRTESFPASYWRHLEFNLRRCERAWRDRTAAAGRAARPDLEQASPPSKSREASSATAVGDPEETG